MPVHYIEMDNGSAALDGGQNIVGQMGEIGRQNRRCEFDQNRRFPVSGDSHDFSKIGRCKPRNSACCGREIDAD